MRSLFRRFVFCGAAGAALAWSAAAGAQGPSPETSYGYEQTRPNRPLLITGSSLLVGSYATSAIIGMANDREADERLAIPLVGPWLDLADRDCDIQPCDNESWSKAALITSGVLQGVGLIGVVSSFFVPEERFRIWGGGGARAGVASAPSVRVVPSPAAVGRGGTGLALIGTF
ncbi:MAG TPA: hypothetical protein VFS43_07135 [Polyangiaceae bacterium]|nr:hypothetical protein [Polyangiaceae bacterium]